MNESLTPRAAGRPAAAGAGRLRHRARLHRPAPDQRAAVTPRMASAPASNGAIFQAATYRPLFEDRRARHVGDMLTIVIIEKTSAGKTGARHRQQDRQRQLLGRQAAGPEHRRHRPVGRGCERREQVRRTRTTTRAPATTSPARIGVTVTEVLPNGNLIVSGEKQVAIEQGHRVHPLLRHGQPGHHPDRQHGRRRPRSPTRASSTAPTASIDRGRDDGQLVSRFFLSVLPF